MSGVFIQITDLMTFVLAGVFNAIAAHVLFYKLAVRDLVFIPVLIIHEGLSCVPEFRQMSYALASFLCISYSFYMSHLLF